MCYPNWNIRYKNGLKRFWCINTKNRLPFFLKSKSCRTALCKPRKIIFLPFMLNIEIRCLEHLKNIFRSVYGTFYHFSVRIALCNCISFMFILMCFELFSFNFNLRSLLLIFHFLPNLFFFLLAFDIRCTHHFYVIRTHFDCWPKRPS